MRKLLAKWASPVEVIRLRELAAAKLHNALLVELRSYPVGSPERTETYVMLQQIMTAADARKAKR